jgi:hypothetical protein
MVWRRFVCGVGLGWVGEEKKKKKEEGLAYIFVGVGVRGRGDFFAEKHFDGRVF